MVVDGHTSAGDTETNATFEPAERRSELRARVLHAVCLVDEDTAELEIF